MIKPTFIPSVIDSPFKDEPLEKLLAVLNVSRELVKLPKITFSRLNMMLKKMGKSKKNWDRNIFIASVLDRKNAALYFWWVIKSQKTLEKVKRQVEIGIIK